MGLLGLQPATAQTPANMSIVSGNGQVVCLTCRTPTIFQPMIVKVTDANGQPIGNQQVSWTALPSSYPGAPPNFFDFSYTDGNGVTQNPLTAIYQGGSPGNPFLQYIIKATAGNATVTFTETQSLTTSEDRATPLVVSRLVSPAVGTTLQGTTGGTSTTSVQVHVDGRVYPVQGASVRLISDPPQDPTKVPSASCATGAGADPGSVLTDQNGDATCTVVFGPVAGTGSFFILVGGVDPQVAPDYIPLTAPVGFNEYGPMVLDVRPGVPGLITVNSGNNQNIVPGQTTAPLVAKVTDASGLNPISGANVIWTVTPAGAATFAPNQSTSNAQGLVQTVATLSATASGVVQVRAALATNSNIATTFTINTLFTISALQKVSGDQQSAAIGQAFGQPLVVQVNGTNGQPAVNATVGFSINGPGTLSSNTAVTDSTGRAQVNVTAGSTQGTITVTAAAGAFSQSFTLTVIPPGPTLTQGGFVNGADFKVGSLSPCSIATIIGAGIASNIQGIVVPGNIVGPLPYTLANVRVSFNNSQAPIYSVSNVNGQQQVTVQIPCDVTPGSSVPVTVSVSGASANINIPILTASPGVFLTTMSDGRRRIVAVRPDGSFVSLENPARKGEIVRAYVTGLAAVNPPVGTNSIAVPGTDSVVLGQVIVGVNNAGTRLVSARVAPNLIGVYEVAFQVPTDAPAGNDVIFSVGINAVGDTQTQYSAGTSIPIL